MQDIKKGFAAAVRAAGLDGFTFHDLRHTFATRLAERGIGEDGALRPVEHEDGTPVQPRDA